MKRMGPLVEPGRGGRRLPGPRFREVLHERDRTSYRALGRRRGLPHEHQEASDLVAGVLACEAREAGQLAAVAQRSTHSATRSREAGRGEERQCLGVTEDRTGSAAYQSWT